MTWKITPAFDPFNLGERRLDFRFAETKSLVNSVTGQTPITFTRASSGTYVDSDGLIKTATSNIPRFDHNPTTGASLGLLVEEQRVNLLVRSAEFNDSVWIKSGSTVTANSINAPNGTLSADTLVESTDTSTHSISLANTNLAANTYTFSVFAKAGGRSNMQLTESATTGSRANFNLSTGTISSGAGSPNASIQAFGNGWFRCSISATLSAGATFNANIALAVDNSIGGLVPSYAGNGTSSIYIWGAQLEVGFYSTSYIPTTSTAVTRSADAARIIGTDFGNFYSNTGSTALAYARSIGLSTGNEYALGFGSSGDGAQIRETNTQMIGMFRGSHGSDANGLLLPTGIRKTAIAYAPSARSIFAMNGNIYFGGTASATLSYPGQMGIGSNGDLNNYWNGTISRIAYWPLHLGEDSLRRLTQ